MVSIFFYDRLSFEICNLLGKDMSISSEPIIGDLLSHNPHLYENKIVPCKFECSYNISRKEERRIAYGDRRYDAISEVSIRIAKVIRYSLQGIVMLFHITKTLVFLPVMGPGVFLLSLGIGSIPGIIHGISLGWNKNKTSPYFTSLRYKAELYACYTSDYKWKGPLIDGCSKGIGYGLVLLCISKNLLPMNLFFIECAYSVSKILANYAIRPIHKYIVLSYP